MTLVPTYRPDLATLSELATKAQAFADTDRAESTMKGYWSDWRHFTTWCAAHGLVALPAQPETIALYLTDHAGKLAVGTLSRRITSIGVAHELYGHEPPTGSSIVRRTRRGIARAYGTAQVGKEPLRTADLRRMIRGLDLRTTIGLRDRALLVLGFAGALRRSELVALDVADLTERDEGLVVTIRRSKTDQEGEGAEIGVPFGSDPDTCPVRAVRDWRARAGLEGGKALRSVALGGRVSDRGLHPSAVATVVKRSAERVGLDPANYSGHSLRAGLITSAAEAGVPERDIMAHSRHQSVAVMRRYIRGATLFKDNAAAAVGL